ncbi:general stress protein [Nocardia sp. NPDC051570]|uniref:general stress protein n=1 Tax=Nocardia sp. NPDC051570 TaxID=3364324 RepID=UPI00378F7201
MPIHSGPPLNDHIHAAPVDAGYQIIASYRDYSAAQGAVDYLSDSGFAVENLRIVGHDISTVEAVTGRMTTARAAVIGMAAGAWWGLFIGLLLGIFTLGTAWFGVIIGAVLIGTVWGAVFGYVGHWATRGRRDFSSVSTLAAEHYDVVCTPEFGSEATRLLAAMR